LPVFYYLGQVQLALWGEETESTDFLEIAAQETFANKVCLTGIIRTIRYRDIHFLAVVGIYHDLIPVDVLSRVVRISSEMSGHPETFSRGLVDGKFRRILLRRGRRNEIIFLQSHVAL
jgi:hypothetical protein